MHDIFKPNGPLISTAGLSAQQRQDAEVYFHHREKAECALTTTSSWYGGDYMEFGAHDLNTFRNFLSAFHMSGMCKPYEKDTRFYAFDIFGKLDAHAGEHADYFKPYSDQGDQIATHNWYLQQHGLYVDQCHLVQGLFKDTLTQEFKDAWRAIKPAGDHSETALHLPAEHRNPKQREIGFACIDCNLGEFYKTVFEWIFDAMAPNSYIYMDEGLQNPDVIGQWQQFRLALAQMRSMGSVYIRNAGGFGSLWRLYPVTNLSPLEL